MVNKGQCFLMCFLGTLCALFVWAIVGSFIAPLATKAHDVIVEYIDSSASSESEETTGSISDIINNEGDN